MDVSALLIQLLSNLWYFIPIVIIIAVLKTAWFKGVFGEFLVNTIAKWRLNSDSYHLIKNVTLRTDDGGTTQVDHIIVSIYGVFVVETKNMKGWIFGRAKQKMWTQQIYKHKTTFQNPLHQNYKHVKTISSLLDLDENHIHSVIVFIGDSVFKTPMPDNVIHGGGYVDFIKSHNSPVISEAAVLSILEKIDNGRLSRSLKTHRAHAQHVKHIVQNKQTAHRDNLEAQPTCHKCGANMVQRTAKKGKNAGNTFWGCSNFPSCRAVQRMEC